MSLTPDKADQSVRARLCNCSGARSMSCPVTLSRVHVDTAGGGDTRQRRRIPNSGRHHRDCCTDTLVADMLSQDSFTSSCHHSIYSVVLIAGTSRVVDRESERHSIISSRSGSGSGSWKVSTWVLVCSPTRPHAHTPIRPTQSVTHPLLAPCMQDTHPTPWAVQPSRAHARARVQTLVEPANTTGEPPAS